MAAHGEYETIFKGTLGGGRGWCGWTWSGNEAHLAPCRSVIFDTNAVAQAWAVRAELDRRMALERGQFGRKDPTIPKKEVRRRK